MSFVGKYATFKSDPENRVYKVVSSWGDSVELEEEKEPHEYFEAIPVRLLSFIEKPITPGSIGVDGEGDMWLCGPDGLWDYLSTAGGRVRFSYEPDYESPIDFDSTPATIADCHGGFRLVYQAP